MDANGQQFWMLADEADWDLDAPRITGVSFDAERRVLRLAEAPVVARRFDTSEEPPGTPGVRLLPQAIDEYGGRATWHSPSGQLRASSESLPGWISIHGADATPQDLALGAGGIVALVFEDRVELADVRGRFDPHAVRLPNAGAWRVAVHPHEGFVLIEQELGSIRHLVGKPMPRRPGAEYAATTWRPEDESVDPPRLLTLAGIAPLAGERFTDSICDGAERLLLLAERDGASELVVVDLLHGETNRLRLLLTPDVPIVAAASLAPFAEDRVALIVPGFREALSYAIPASAEDGTALLPTGDHLPIPDHDGGPFAKGPTRTAHVPIGGGRTRRLQRLSTPSLRDRGIGAARRALESDDDDHTWHRLYLEARIPPGCSIRIWLSAPDGSDAPDPADTMQWHPHDFGQATGDLPLVPRGAWLEEPCELPFHPGLLGGECVWGQAGLFTCLVQRVGRRTSSVRGRRLWVRIELRGNGRVTPEVAALRIYGSRFSYVDQYLPELYHESLFGPDADDPGSATAPDFLERFLGLFESFLTPLEDRVGAAHLLTDPTRVPEESIEWLARWIGAVVDGADSAEQKRSALRAAPRLHRRRGTLDGLEMALEVATGGDLDSRLGAVRRNEIVVVEDHRLRRTFATILGANFETTDDPLLVGPLVSGNSFVGDTLFLGDESEREFLAVFADELATREAEDRAIDEFFDRLAHRATIVVHETTDPEALARIRRVAAVEAPAHVEVRVVSGSDGLIVGLSALVGIDTFLVPEPEPRPLRLGGTRLGSNDRMTRPESLDPRLGGGHPRFEARDPEAELDDRSVELGRSFVFDASDSRAFEGRRIARFRWTRES